MVSCAEWDRRQHEARASAVRHAYSPGVLKMKFE
jgi:hypothetical protein